MKLGKARYGGGGSFAKRKYFKLKDGESVFRILPPLGDLADRGIWSVFYRVHYGYVDSQGKSKAFQSPLVKNNKTKMIEVPDPALEKIEKLKAELAKAKATGNVALTEKLAKLVGDGKILGQFNLDSNHYMNVLDTQGNIGVLKIRHKAKLALEATIKRLRENGVDPLSPEDGRFFVFRRTGKGLDTTFQVDILKEKMNVPGVGMVEKDVVHVLDDSIVSRLESEAADLDKIYKKISAEEVARIVTEGPTAVDEILGSSSDGNDTPEESGVPESSSAESVSIPAVPTVATSGYVTTNVSHTAAEPTPAQAVSTPQSEQSDEDFLRSMGLI